MLVGRLFRAFQQRSRRNVARGGLNSDGYKLDTSFLDLMGCQRAPGFLWGMPLSAVQADGKLIFQDPLEVRVEKARRAGSTEPGWDAG